MKFTNNPSSNVTIVQTEVKITKIKLKYLKFIPHEVNKFKLTTKKR